MRFKVFQKGVSIYLAIVIMFVLLGIGLGISTLLVGQIRMIRGMGHSMVALYAADTGIERELSEDNPVGTTYSGYVDLNDNGIPDDDVDSFYTVEIVPEPDCVSTGVWYYIRSFGTYQGVRRAIELTVPPPVPIILDYNDVDDWARTFIISIKSQDERLDVSGEGVWVEKSLIKWSLADIPPGTTIDKATFYFTRSVLSPTFPDPEETIYLRSISDDSWSYAVSTVGELWSWPTTGTIGEYTTIGGPQWEKLSVDITSVVQAENDGDGILSMKWEFLYGWANEAYASPSGAIGRRPYIEVIYGC